MVDGRDALRPHPREARRGPVRPPQAKPEFDACAAAARAHSVPVREVVRAATAAAAGHLKPSRERRARRIVARTFPRDFDMLPLRVTLPVGTGAQKATKGEAMSACAQCGTVAKPTDKFCNVCGTPIAAAPPSGAPPPASGGGPVGAPPPQAHSARLLRAVRGPAPGFGGPPPGSAAAARPPRCQMGHDIAPGASYCAQGHPIALDQMQFGAPAAPRRDTRRRRPAPRRSPASAAALARLRWAPAGPRVASLGAPPPGGSVGLPRGFGAPPPQPAFGAPPPQPAFGAPPQQAFGAPPPQPGYGTARRSCRALVRRASPRRQRPPSAPRGQPGAKILRGFLVAYGINPSGDFWPLDRRAHGRRSPRRGRRDRHHAAGSDHLVAPRGPRGRRGERAAVAVEDTGSTNGTFVNDEHIGFNGRRDLRDGDRVRFGGFTTIVKVIGRV